MTGEDIQLFITRRKITITGLAELTKIRREDLHRYLNGKEIPVENEAIIGGVMQTLYNYDYKESKVK